MGIESFRVKLHGGPATPAQAIEVIAGMPHARPGKGFYGMSGYSSFILDDGSSVFELLVAEKPFDISCRFTLCHPPSVDSAFLALMRELMIRLGVSAELLDGEARAYSLDTFGEFAAAAFVAIAERRAEWIAMFGPATLAATTTEVYDKLILPQCVPATAAHSAG